MDDYSLVGRQKLEWQAKGDLESIRCPLDSAIMMITGGVASRREGGGRPTYRRFERYPISPKWTVVSVNLECSACRRRSTEVPVTEPTGRPVSTGPAPR